MRLNEALIQHYKCVEIPINKLKDRVSLSESYLMEKPTWYEIDGRLKYFKVRNDYRLFAEQFFSAFGREILGLDTLDYQLASVRTIDQFNPNGGEKKIGLLSENFQDSRKYNYYLVSELLDSEITDLLAYGYSLTGILEYFKFILDDESYKKCEDFLIRLFIADAFTMQFDRNPNNIGFQIPKIPNIDYKSRLRGSVLKSNGCMGNLVIDTNGFAKLKDFSPSKVYDNERIIGVDHKNVSIYKKGDIWRPVWPYNPDLLFNSQEEAEKVQESIYDGVDPNLAELFMSFPEYWGLIERLAKGDEYREILERFTKKDSQVILSKKEQEGFKSIFEDRRKVFQRVFSLK